MNGERRQRVIRLLGHCLVAALVLLPAMISAQQAHRDAATQRMQEAFDELERETGPGPAHSNEQWPTPYETDGRPSRLKPLRRHGAAPPPPARILPPSGQPLITPANTLPQLWSAPNISNCPPTAVVGDTIRIAGNGLGDPRQPERTRVIFPTDINAERMVEGELLAISDGRSGTFRGIEVRVPHGAVKSRIRMTTPGGSAECPYYFDPVYRMQLSPDVLSPTGQLGFLHVYDSRMSLADGVDNSSFQASEQMRATLGLGDYIFTFPRFDQKVDLVVGATTLRVRIPGSKSGFEYRQQTIRSHAPQLRFDGDSLLFDLSFESDGVEFIGEYETQDVFSGRIGWQHFMNIQANDLTVSATIPLRATSPLGSNAVYHWYRIESGDIEIAVDFNASFDIFEIVQFEVDQPLLLSLLKTGIADKMKSYLLAAGFVEQFDLFMTGYVRNYFAGDPVRRIDISTAPDGGMRIDGRSR